MFSRGQKIHKNTLYTQILHKIQLIAYLFENTLKIIANIHYFFH